MCVLTSIDVGAYAQTPAYAFEHPPANKVYKLSRYLCG